MAIMSGRQSLLAVTLVVATLLGCNAQGTCTGSTLIATGTITTGIELATYPGYTYSECCAACFAVENCLCMEWGVDEVNGGDICKTFSKIAASNLDAPFNHTIVFFGSRVTADPVVTMFNGEKIYWSAPKDAAYNMLSAPGFAINAVIGDFTAAGSSVGTGEHNNEWLVAIGARFGQSTLEVAVDTTAAVSMFTDDAGVVRMRLDENNAADLLSVKMDGKDASHMLGSGATIQTENSTIYFPQSSSNPIVGVVAVLRTEEFEVSIYNEDAASYHLDFAVTMFTALDSAAMHGVLGQSWAWRKDSKIVTHTIEGEVEHYLVTDGLTGTDFKYSKYNVAIPSKGRKMLDMRTAQDGVAVASAAYGM